MRQNLYYSLLFSMKRFQIQLLKNTDTALCTVKNPYLSNLEILSTSSLCCKSWVSQIFNK